MFYMFLYLISCLPGDSMAILLRYVSVNISNKPVTIIICCVVTDSYWTFFILYIHKSKWLYQLICLSVCSLVWLVQAVLMQIQSRSDAHLEQQAGWIRASVEWSSSQGGWSRYHAESDCTPYWETVINAVAHHRGWRSRSRWLSDST